MEVPTCALNRRRSSTVLVRIMDMCEFCKRPGVRAMMDTDETKTSHCGLCSKVTSLGQICAPGGTSSKRVSSKWSAASKKLRLCAASCLLLLAGGFPAASAAPTLGNGVTLRVIATEAELAYKDISKYKEEFKRVYLWDSEETFAEYLKSSRFFDNQLKRVSWFERDLLPECKVFESAADQACLLSVISNKDQQQLQHLHQLMYRSMNYVTAKFEKMVTTMKQTETGTTGLNNKMSESLRLLKQTSGALKIYLQGKAPYEEGLKDIAELPEITRLEDELKAVTFSGLLNFVQYFHQLYAKLSNWQPT